MTTPVIITVPEPNHKPVHVRVQNATAGDQTNPQGWIDGPIHKIEIGRSRQLFVYSGQRLLIEEAA